MGERELEQQMDPFDVIIIGGGPGGYVAAIRAAQLGLKTAVIERKHLGGICLNWGCIPTKSLLRTAEVYELLQDAQSYGLRAENVGFDIAGVVERSRKAAGRLSKGVDGLLKKNKVRVIWGEARIVGSGQIEVTETSAQPPRGALGPGTYTSRNIVVATGARPRSIPGVEPDGDRIWTYFEAMTPTTIPESIAIIGSGAIGAEFASFYRSMGSEVTLLEALPQILPAEDEEIAAIVRKQFRKRGIDARESVRVTEAAIGDGAVEVSFRDTDGTVEAMTVERVISAVGVIGNTEGLGLGQLGVAIEDGTITTDSLGRTNIEGIFAIGDVAGGPMLAHKAQHQGVACIEAIAGGTPHPINPRMIPACTYCSPQVASVGLSEHDAEVLGTKVRIGRFPLIGNGKAVVLGETDGMVKTLFDASTGELLGAHLVGPDVTELIQGFVIAMNVGATEQQLSESVFPHPSLSEAMHESVLSASGRVLHI